VFPHIGNHGDLVVSGAVAVLARDLRGVNLDRFLIEIDEDPAIRP
jgi:hypothetical protein